MSERWILRAKVASKTQGRPLYFARMTGIGPMTTAKQAEARVFATREEALRSPAVGFPWKFFEPERLAGAPPEEP